MIRRLFLAAIMTVWFAPLFALGQTPSTDPNVHGIPGSEVASFKVKRTGGSTFYAASYVEKKPWYIFTATDGKQSKHLIESIVSIAEVRQIKPGEPYGAKEILAGIAPRTEARTEARSEARTEARVSPPTASESEIQADPATQAESSSLGQSHSVTSHLTSRGRKALSKTSGGSGSGRRGWKH
jgi:hypothetical protein